MFAEAVLAILQYTENVDSLLSRRKISKELVFRYLHANQVDGVSPSLDKKSMIELLLSHWGETKKKGAKVSIYCTVQLENLYVNRTLLFPGWSNT